MFTFGLLIFLWNFADFSQIIKCLVELENIGSVISKQVALFLTHFNAKTIAICKHRITVLHEKYAISLNATNE